MILPALTALLVAVGPLLRGAWDPWAQALLEAAVVCGLALWLTSRVLLGFIPVASPRTIAWAVALAALGAASAWSSPVHALARGGYWVFLCGLWLFPAMGALGKDGRSRVDQAVRASAWALMTLAFYQHFRLGDARPASALVNQNIYAGAVLMLLPLAVEMRDWLLALGLAWSLCWTHSLGAWLALSAAVALTQRRRAPWLFWPAAAAAAACAVVLYGRLDSPELLHRWGWWKAAAAMAADRPLTGFGPGSFAWVLPAYRDRAPYGLLSLYAHQYPLETAAGYGLPFALLWFGGLWRCVTRDESHKRFAAVAALLNSLWDYPLSMPANFWLFCYCAASTIPESGLGVNVPSRRKLPVAAAACGLGLALLSRALAAWSADGHLARADAALAAGALDEARVEADRGAALSRGDPQARLLAGAVEERRGHWLSAAAQLEEAARLDPYRGPTWVELSWVYRRLGRPELADSVLVEAAGRGLLKPGSLR